MKIATYKIPGTVKETRSGKTLDLREDEKVLINTEQISSGENSENILTLSKQIGDDNEKSKIMAMMLLPSDKGQREVFVIRKILS